MARRRRRRSPVSTIVIVVVVLAILGVVGYLVVDNFVVRTAVIESGNMGKEYKAQAVIVRNETVVDVEGLTSVKYYAYEGQTIYKGERIADVYASGFSQSDINKLLNTRANISSHLKTTLASAYTDQTLERHDSTITDAVREFTYLVQNKATGNLLNMERQLTSALNLRMNYLKGKYGDSDSTLRGLIKEEETLSKRIQGWTNTELADMDCVVSFYTDGYENMLAPSGFDDITLQQVQTVLAGETPQMTVSQRGRTAVYRKINPQGWYLLLVSRDDTWNPVINQTYKVQLAGFENLIIDGVVTSYYRSGNDLLVRMSVSGDVQPVINTRTAQAGVSEMYVSGLRVPLNAIRRQDGMQGVVPADSKHFIPVEVVMQDHSYAIIESLVPGALQAGQKIIVF